MTDIVSSPEAKLAKLYEAKRAAGLIDVKFFVGNREEAVLDEVREEVLRLEDAIALGDYTPLVFGDTHRA